jgi:RNA polymerase sigma-70 factor (ECF subfamily)
MTDAAIQTMPVALLRAGAGDEAAFADLVREHESMVLGIALHVLGDRAQAEDLAQEVFLQLYRKIQEIESPRHLIHWLRKVTTNRCIDAVRRRRFRLVALTEASEARVAAKETDLLASERVRRLLIQLPPKQAAVITLRYQEEMELTEIAQTLGMPLNTVKSHLRRGVEMLRRGLGAAHGSDR